MAQAMIDGIFHNVGLLNEAMLPYCAKKSQIGGDVVNKNVTHYYQIGRRLKKNYFPLYTLCKEEDLVQ